MMPFLLTRSRTRGLTLLEMLVVLAIAAAVATAAVPSFEALRGRIALDVAARAFHDALHLTRAEAMARQRRVAMVPVDGADWRSGWIVFVDENLDGHVDAGELELMRHPPLAEVISVTMRRTFEARPVIAYDASGFARSGVWQWMSGSVMFSSKGLTYCVVINAFGRPRLSMAPSARRCHQDRQDETARATRCSDGEEENVNVSGATS